MPLNSRHLRPRSRTRLDPDLRQAWSWGDPSRVAQEIGGQGRVLCHIDGGEVALELALSGAHVVAVGDEPARQLLALKCAAAQLSHVEALQLMGRLEAGRRVHIYHQLRGSLPAATRRYWDRFEGTLRVGLMDNGGLERRLARIRPVLRRLWPAGAGLFEEEEADLLAGLRGSLRWRLLDGLQPLPGLRLQVEDMLERGTARRCGALAWLLFGELHTLEGLEWSWLDPRRFPELQEAVGRIEIRSEPLDVLLPGHERVYLGSARPQLPLVGKACVGFGAPLKGARGEAARGLLGPMLSRPPAG